jgi:hypothetical protein
MMKASNKSKREQMIQAHDEYRDARVALFDAREREVVARAEEKLMKDRCIIARKALNDVVVWDGM